VTFFAGDLEVEFLGEAEVDLFLGGFDVRVGEAGGEEVGEGLVELVGGDVVGVVLAGVEAGNLEVGLVVQKDGADGDAGDGRFLEALGAGVGEAVEGGGAEGLGEDFGGGVLHTSP
jgi:hypothetical protein